MQPWRRTHTCGELRETDVGKTVTLNGWVNTYRDQGALVFIDLRDRYGVTQVVFEPGRPELVAAAQQLRSEFVVAVTGTVAQRLPGKDNAALPTGKVEVKAESLEILNRCPTPPFEVTAITREEVRKKVEEDLAGEELRLQYRYLDLRRPRLQHILVLRHRLNKVIRDHLDARGFLEIETPLLGRSTPEGARDYLVPSRVFPKSWFALPQSPQLYKQLLMVAGYDKYFQIARCLRDEDLRANRQPEFTQLDLEMSFCDMDDVFEVIEKLTAEVFAKCIGVTIPLPLPRLKYADAMLRFGSDKPDLRYGLEIVDLTDFHSQSGNEHIRRLVENDGKIRALVAKGAGDKLSRKKRDEIRDYVKRFVERSGTGVWTDFSVIQPDVSNSNLLFEKFIPEEQRKAQRLRLGAEPGDLWFSLGVGTEGDACQGMGFARTRIAEDLKLYDPEKPEYKLAWVIDFPLFTWDAEEKRWAANHHPFTAPMDEDLPKLDNDVGSVRAKAYDLVINGDECGGGSIRIHSPEVQARIFALLGMEAEQAKQRFGFLLDALKYGAPPHGGIALGLDRWTMMLARTGNIRDVIAFPKNQKARDLMTGAPAPVDPKQLKELGL